MALTYDILSTGMKLLTFVAVALIDPWHTLTGIKLLMFSVAEAMTDP